MKFDFGLRIRNIGPLKDINLNTKFSTNKTVIYAKNGSGKSFFSRTLQKIEANDTTISNSLISFGEQKSDLKIEIGPGEKEPTRYFEIELNRDSEANIKLSSDSYILHVFNSRYVEDNIKKRSYAPVEDKLRNGYILGKGNIDLTKEKEELQQKKSEYDNQKEVVENNIQASFDLYKGKFALGRFSSFKLLLQKKLDDIKEVVHLEGIDEQLALLSTNWEKLRNFPDDVKDIEFLQDFQDTIVNDKIAGRIIQSVPKIKFEDSLEKYIATNRSFIEMGVKIQNEEGKCPFCHQSLGESAIEIIKAYHNFLDSQEKNMIDFCEKEQGKCSETIENLSNLKNKYDLIKASYESLKAHLVDFDETLPELTLLEDIKPILSKLSVKLKNKIDNTAEPVDVDSLIEEYQEKLQELKNLTAIINSKIIDINKKKNKISKQGQELKEEVIKAIEKKLFNSSEVENLLTKQKEISVLEKSIQEKENTIRKSKQTEILKTLKYFLNFFFQDKYSISDDFVIIFQEKDITGELEHVLSDGEKSVVAFCHYLAETHILIQEDLDYKRLFFIIDDPISSLDSDYIYDMAQVIRNIKNHFPVEYEKYIILSHNVEFVSILKRNKISSNFFELKNGEVEEIKDDRFNIPYISHLSDIYRIYEGKEEPKHTTANSMRQVLEGIKTFLCPSKKLEDFILTEEKFKDTSLYSYIQDRSHGNIFFNSVLNNKEIKSYISDIINYIKNSIFRAQLDDIDNSDK